MRVAENKSTRMAEVDAMRSRQWMVVACVLLLCAGAVAQTTVRHGIDAVDPFIGTDFGGEAFIGAAVPFGVVKAGPDVVSFDGHPSSNGYASTGVVLGFSHLHLNGAAGKYGNILLLPMTGEFDRAHMGSVRDSEQAAPGYYATHLKRYDVGVELTATAHAALHRYAFPAGKAAHLVLDVDHCLTRGYVAEGQRFLGGEIHVVSPHRIEGVGRYRGGWNEGGEYRVYYSIELNHDAAAVRTWAGGAPEAVATRVLSEDKPLGAVMDFAGDAAQTVEAKVGISFVSVEQARANAARELPDWDFAATRARTAAAWEKALDTIEVDGGTERDRRIFYTALYRAQLTPSDRTGENPLWTSQEPYYDDYYAIWDTFRTQGPLLTLIDEKRERDIVRSLVDIGRHEEYLPEGRSGNDTGRTQGGSNADVMIADAYVKGIDGIDYAAAYTAMQKDATVEPKDARKWGRGGIDEFNTLGYVASDTERAGSRTVEYSYDNFAIAEVACGLGHRDEANRLARSASNWTNLWDADLSSDHVSGFLRPKDKQGRWAAPYLTLRGTWPDFLYEGDIWTYSLYAPQDVRKLIDVAGGPEKFLYRLNRFFVKEHFDMSNEPGFLTPMLFHWLGRPDLTADVLAMEIDKNFNDTRAGIPGNDDNGAMASWYIFAALGMYPVAGQDVYLVFPPRFREARVHLKEGKLLRIVAENADAAPFNRYVQSVTWNGAPVTQSWFRHAMIAEGGTLRIVLGAEPSSWGRTTPPPSLSDRAGDFCPAR